MPQSGKIGRYGEAEKKNLMQSSRSKMPHSGRHRWNIPIFGRRDILFNSACPAPLREEKVSPTILRSYRCAICAIRVLSKPSLDNKCVFEECWPTPRPYSSFINPSNTPFDQPKPSCNAYSPPPASRVISDTLYFSTIRPVLA